MIKNILLTCTALLCVIVTYSQKLPDKNITKTISFQEAKSHEKLIKARNNKLGDNYDLYYHRMNWYIDPSVNQISGYVCSYFAATSSMSQMEFELNQIMTVDSIIYHNSNLSFTHANNIILINLPSTITPWSQDSIFIYYHGTPPQGVGFGSFIQDDHNGAPIIWTLSEPFGAPDWWPCKNSLSDKIDSIDVYITTPNAYRAASNGLLVSENTAGSNKIYHWKHRYPIVTYLIALAVTNYSVYSDFAQLQNGTLEILNYVFPEDLNDAQQQTPDLIPVMQLYDSLFSDYPFLNEKYGHAQFGWGGGMEHQTMTFIVNFGYDLMAHELAHQWFGDKVTCHSWHDIWINEGFATFLTGLTYYFLNTNNAWKYWKQYNVDDITSEPDGSVYCDDTTNVSIIFSGRLSYNKGAMVLNMLRVKIGDSAMFSCMKNFITDPQLSYSFAETDDFREHAEAASGMNLVDFFQDWIYGQGYPIYSLHTTIHPDSIVDLIITQQQSHPSVYYFELPVPVKFSNNTKDTLLFFDNTYDGQVYSFKLNFIPNTTTFDPEYELIAKIDNNIVNIEENNLSAHNIYPNPFNNIINIENNNNQFDRIEIYNIESKKVFEKTFKEAVNKTQIDLKHLKQGVYFLKIISTDNIFIQHIVKL